MKQAVNYLKSYPDFIPAWASVEGIIISHTGISGGIKFYQPSMIFMRGGALFDTEDDDVTAIRRD